ncbi:formate dehydrogenase subunit delta [Dongia soli]|uniref:Formate dehydrogenase subunit delta n=1 Tax=Dongia soli TaxID=600628 RepID=A0ABU5E862_9PROT|nr:formate dehydrogenase subunit delta [Dongia soli]MDY0882036.1 formate dehydrogenase subunit delta [Dongia soli]
MSNNTETLIRMANQIGDFFNAYPEAEAVPQIATHIRKFWDPRMRKAILAHIADHQGEGLKPHVLQALKSLPN